MTQIKVNPWPSLQTWPAAKTAHPHTASMEDTIINLQQKVDELSEHQDRTSFYLREISSWANNLPVKNKK